MTNKNKVPYATICKAIEQDEKAILEIVQHYKNEIQQLAIRQIIDEQGQTRFEPDADMVLRLQTKLMLSIGKFKILPKKKF